MENKNPFATPYQEVDYVYNHVCPIYKALLYTGRGSGSRAWMFQEPFRDRLHADYLNDLVSRGYLPSDWVIITHRNLSTEAAIVIEREQITCLKPRFNKIPGISLVKFDSALMQRAWLLRQNGLSYSNIATELNLSTMTVYRALNNLTPALGAKLAELT